MTTFTLDTSQIAAIASLHSATPGTADRKITPILAAIKLTVSPSTVIAVATNRYIATRLEFPMGDYAHTLHGGDTEALTVEVLLDSKEWVELAKRTKGNKTFMFTFDSEAATRGPVTVTYGPEGLTVGSFSQVEGNYPTVERLIPDETQPLGDFAPALNMAYVTAATKAFHPSSTAERKDMPWRIESPLGADPGLGKSSPVVLTACIPGRKAGVSLRAIVQPNLAR